MFFLKKLLLWRLTAKGFKLVTQEYLDRELHFAAVGRQRLRWILGQSGLSKSFSAHDIETILNHSKSQLGQDVLALSVVGASRKGYFVEFGATDGVSLSNTHLLEKRFGWQGLLCEPARGWHSDLMKNRSAELDWRCVHTNSDLMVDFLETKLPELSTMRGFGTDDMHAPVREDNEAYEVETVSLLDLLKSHSAPKHIDFMSIDTEGSEFEILNAFDFNQYSFGTITVEHNYTSNREKVRTLLLSKGYRQVYPELSDFDDWFVPRTNQNIPG